MLALSYQGSGKVRVDDVPEPRIESDDDVVKKFFGSRNE